MSSFFLKFNFLIGIVLVIPAFLLGIFLGEISKIIFIMIQNFTAFFDPLSRGYIDFLYNGFVVRLFSTAVLSATAIFGPILLIEKTFKDLKVNWLPSIILLSLMFIYMLAQSLQIYLKLTPTMNFMEHILAIISLVSFVAGAFLPLMCAFLHFRKDRIIFRSPWTSEV